MSAAPAMIARAAVMKAATDGYHSCSPPPAPMRSTRPSTRSRSTTPATDFAPVALIASTPILLVARKDLPATTCRSSSPYAKAHQATMQYGSPGAGSTSHLGCALFNTSIKVEVTHVP